MRINNVFSGRPADYDRGPLTISNFFGTVAQGPHGATQRYAYTVPSGRKTRVEMLFNWFTRTTAATTIGMAQSWHQYTKSGGSAHDWLVATTFAIAAGTQDVRNVGYGAVIYAGDLVQGMTQDTSVGGSGTYDVSSKMTEFDA